LYDFRKIRLRGCKKNPAGIETFGPAEGKAGIYPLIDISKNNLPRSYKSIYL